MGDRRPGQSAMKSVREMIDECQERLDRAIEEMHQQFGDSSGGDSSLGILSNLDDSRSNAQDFLQDSSGGSSSLGVVSDLDDSLTRALAALSPGDPSISPDFLPSRGEAGRRTPTPRQSPPRRTPTPPQGAEHIPALHGLMDRIDTLVDVIEDTLAQSEDSSLEIIDDVDDMAGSAGLSDFEISGFQSRTEEDFTSFLSTPGPGVSQARQSPSPPLPTYFPTPAYKLPSTVQPTPGPSRAIVKRPGAPAPLQQRPAETPVRRTVYFAESDTVFTVERLSPSYFIISDEEGSPGEYDWSESSSSPSPSPSPERPPPQPVTTRFGFARPPPKISAGPAPQPRATSTPVRPPSPGRPGPRPVSAPQRPPSAIPQRPPSAIPQRPPSAIPQRPPAAAPQRPPSASGPRTTRIPPPATPTGRPLSDRGIPGPSMGRPVSAEGRPRPTQARPGTAQPSQPIPAPSGIPGPSRISGPSRIPAPSAIPGPSRIPGPSHIAGPSRIPGAGVSHIPGPSRIPGASRVPSPAQPRTTSPRTPTTARSIPKAPARYTREPPPDPTRSEVDVPESFDLLERRVFDADERIRRIEAEIFSPIEYQPDQGQPAMSPELRDKFMDSFTRIKQGVSRLQDMVDRRMGERSFERQPSRRMDPMGHYSI